MSKKIAVIGECMIELSQKGAEVSRGFGGDTLNTSVYIARQVAPEALAVNAGQMHDQVSCCVLC